MFNKEHDQEKKQDNGLKEIKPLKDWHIVQNKHDIKIVKGEEIEVPKIFLVGLKTENVIY